MLLPFYLRHLLSIIIMLLPVLAQFGLSQMEEYPFPNLSPPGQVTQEVGNTTIDIRYERPSVRGRTIFGDLVPWNKVWRTGAGYCTRFTFSRDVMVGGQSVTAGTYSLFTIPNPDQWMIIFNRDTTLYGAYRYDSQLDVARFYTPAEQSGRHFEAFTIAVDLMPYNAEIYLSWADIQVHFPVETTTDADIQEYITRELLSGQATDPDLYAGGADYFFMSRRNLTEALALTAMALERKADHGFALSVRINLLIYLGYWDQAEAEVEQAIEMSKKRQWPNEAEKQNDLQYWEGLRTKIQEKRLGAKE